MSTKQAAKTHIAGSASRKKNPSKWGGGGGKVSFIGHSKYLLGVSELKLFAIKNCLFLFFEGCTLERLG